MTQPQRVTFNCGCEEAFLDNGKTLLLCDNHHNAVISGGLHDVQPAIVLTGPKPLCDATVIVSVSDERTGTVYCKDVAGHDGPHVAEISWDDEPSGEEAP